MGDFPDLLEKYLYSRWKECGDFLQNSMNVLNTIEP